MVDAFFFKIKLTSSPRFCRFSRLFPGGENPSPPEECLSFEALEVLVPWNIFFSFLVIEVEANFFSERYSPPHEIRLKPGKYTSPVLGVTCFFFPL